MQPVEVPDYSGFFELALIVIGVASFIVTLTSTKADNKVMRIMSYLALNWRPHTKGNQSFVSMEDRRRHQAMTNAKSKRFNNKPDHPAPNRRAAVAHTKAKDD